MIPSKPAHKFEIKTNTHYPDSVSSGSNPVLGILPSNGKSRPYSPGCLFFCAFGPSRSPLNSAELRPGFTSVPGIAAEIRALGSTSPTRSNGIKEIISRKMRSRVSLATSGQGY